MITIPGKPVSINRSYAVGRGRFYATKAQGDFKRRVAAIALSAKLSRTEPRSITIVTFNSRADIDAPAKSVLDALEGILYDNDRTITALHLYKVRDDGEARLEIYFGDHDIYGSQNRPS